MKPPMREKYVSCRTCKYAKICYDWKQNMPNAIKRPSGKLCPVSVTEIMEAIGLKEEDGMELTTHALSRLFPVAKEETVFDRIKRMNESEMETFLKFIYDNAIIDNDDCVECDSNVADLLKMPAKEIMPNGVEDLCGKHLWRMVHPEDFEDDC